MLNLATASSPYILSLMEESLNENIHQIYFSIINRVFRADDVIGLRYMHGI